MTTRDTITEKLARLLCLNGGWSSWRSCPAGVRDMWRADAVRILKAAPKAGLRIGLAPKKTKRRVK